MSKKKKKIKNKTLKILTHPNPVLRAKNALVSYFDGQLVELAQDMIRTMRNVGGVGIAAPQVGKNIRMAVALIDKKPLVVINPKILNGSVNGKPFDEGCLSLPGKSIRVQRPTWIEFEYDDLRGRTHNRVLYDVNCVIMCHEIDHLDGKLIIDHIDEINAPLPEA